MTGPSVLPEIAQTLASALLPLFFRAVAHDGQDACVLRHSRSTAKGHYTEMGQEQFQRGAAGTVRAMVEARLQGKTATLLVGSEEELERPAGYGARFFHSLLGE